MKWSKKGLIYCPDGSVDWMNNSVLTPQPFLISDNVVRIYASFRDINGIGRIGYLDLDAKNPSNILKISSRPVLDVGPMGCFDDNGIILGDVIRIQDKLYMFYVAFQHVHKVKFYAFSGLAISYDNGETFKRVQRTPIMDRKEEGIFGRCIHSVIYDEKRDIFRVWYSVIYDWTYINNTPYPTYDIKYIESVDGVHFPDEGIQCIKCNAYEYRIGRPKVRILSDNTYEMRYTADTFDKEYISGYAISNDGICWIRKDELGWLTKSKSGFDSQMACYPVVVETKYGTYMIYGGNGMGAEGFGYAELVEE